jgi:ABC-type glycerol-3-phosphate transport system substrate-binding protein
MLMAGNIYGVDDLLYNDFYFGGDATYIGYPTSSGVGNMMSLTSGFAMSAKCADKDAAWAFLRTVLSESYQENIWGLPINKNAFDKKLEEVMTPEYEKDAEGNIKLDENGEKIQISRGGIGMADGSVHEIYAMSQEQADKLLELINTTTRVVNTNNSLIQIETEEAQAFFAGQKSAEEVAKLTQSKVNIYVNEQR